jgi:hypothetical protein
MRVLLAKLPTALHVLCMTLVRFFGSLLREAASTTVTIKSLCDQFGKALVPQSREVSTIERAALVRTIITFGDAVFAAVCMMNTGSLIRQLQPVSVSHETCGNQSQLDMIVAMGNVLHIHESKIKVHELQEEIWDSWVLLLRDSGKTLDGSSKHVRLDEPLIKYLIRAKSLEVYRQSMGLVRWLVGWLLIPKAGL